MSNRVSNSQRSPKKRETMEGYREIMKKFPQIAAILLLVSVLVLIGVYVNQSGESSTDGTELMLTSISGGNRTMLTGLWTASEEEMEPEIVEKYPEVPLYLQTDYYTVRYGQYGTVATSGCGITCLAMVATYLLDEEYLPDEFARRYAMYSVKGGSDWTLFKTSSEELGLPMEMSVKWEDALAALENGQVVITQANPDSIFTDVGHFIVLTGVNEEGRIWVNDPYGGNYGEWSHPRLQDGFANGFEQRQFYHFCNPYWIYAPKSEVWDPYKNMET